MKHFLKILILLFAVQSISSSSKEEWIWVDQLQVIMEQMGQNFGQNRSCEDWADRMSHNAGGFFGKMGPVYTCQERKLQFLGKAKCQDEKIYVLCGKKVQEPCSPSKTK